MPQLPNHCFATPPPSHPRPLAGPYHTAAKGLAGPPFPSLAALVPSIPMTSGWYEVDTDHRLTGVPTRGHEARDA